jgi:chemotaxis protein CheD
MKQITLYIGQYYVSIQPAIIHTLLGSCVAVCLFDPVKKIGGMNHILLPGKADLATSNSSARYGINAMELLINRMIARGCGRTRLKAKVFGGAHLLSSIPAGQGIGRQIVEFCLSFLEKEKIRIVKKDLCGPMARKIYFHTHSGEAFVKRLTPIYYSQIISAEKRHRRLREQQAAKHGEITLFT